MKDNLDKFYTKKEVSNKCIKILYETFNLKGDELFLEPSAGSGSFSNQLKNCVAYDIKPENKNIIQADFLALDLENKNYITIGNPPFGKRNELAIKFFNKCSTISDVIAFIVPNTFTKYSVQKNLNKDFKLTSTTLLEPNSFTDNGKDFKVNCVFQIWVKTNSKYDLMDTDNRIKEKPITKLDNLFYLYQYNGTEQAKNVLEKEWDIAVYRQGYKDYTKKFKYNIKEDREFVESLIKNTKVQVFLIKCHNEIVYNNIMKLDFTKLSKLNLSTPGFGKADFIKYYLERFK